MARVTSDKIRQAILVLGESFDPNLRPERLALFDANGNPITTTLRPRGAWSAFEEYIVNDVVTYGGSVYLAIADKEASAGGNPEPIADNATWLLFVEKGDEGIIWRGNWETFDEYSVNDVVFYEGSSYRALKAIGAGGATPDTPYGTFPSSDPSSGPTYGDLPTTLWPIGEMTIQGSITPDDSQTHVAHLQTQYYVDIFRIPIATAGTIGVFVEYDSLDGYLEIFDSSGDLLAFNDDAGQTNRSSIQNLAVTPGVHYVVFRGRGQGTFTDLYTATLTLGGGATMGDDSAPWAIFAQKGDVGPQGAEGPEGPEGSIGPEGPEGPVGPSGVDFNYQGDWVAQDYAAGVTVRHLNKLWHSSTAALAADEPGTAVLWTAVLEDILQPADNGLPVGGAADQILAKASATDFDTTWIDPPAGGSNGDYNAEEFYASLSACLGDLAWLDTSGTLDDITFDATPGVYKATGNNWVVISRRHGFRTIEAGIKASMRGADAVGNGSFAIVKRITGTTNLALWFFADGINGLFIFNQASSIIASVPASHVWLANSVHWLRVSMDAAGLCTMNLYDTDPDVGSPIPTDTLSHQLAGTNLTNYGPGRSGHPGLRLLGGSSLSSQFRLEDYFMRELT